MHIKIVFNKSRIKVLFLLLGIRKYFGIVIFLLGGKSCIVKIEKWIVFPESRYVNLDPDSFSQECCTNVLSRWKR